MTLTMIIAIIAAMLFGVFCALCLYSVFKNQKDVEKNENRMKGIEKKLGSMTELINDRTEMLESKINEQPIYNVYSDMIDVNPSYPYDVPAESYESAINISDLMSDDFEDILIDDSEEDIESRSIEEDEVLSAFMNSFKAFEHEVIGGGFEEDKTAGEIKTDDKEESVQQRRLPEFEQKENVTEPPVETARQKPAIAEPIRRNEPVKPVEKSSSERQETVKTVGQSTPFKTERSNFRRHVGHDVGKSGKQYTESELEELIR